MKQFLVFVQGTLGDAVTQVRASDRLTDSAVCLVAADAGPDRGLEKLLAGTGRLATASKPILEINPRHELVVALAALGDADRSFKGGRGTFVVRRSAASRRRSSGRYEIVLEPPGAGAWPRGKDAVLT